MQTAATDGTAGSEGSGRSAFEQSAATLPDVSCTSSAGTTTEGTTTEAAATTTAATATALPKAAYVTRMKTIGQSLSTSLNSLGAATTAPKAAAALTAVQTDLRKAADRIESITPP